MHWPQPAIVDVAETHLLAEVEGKVVGRVVIDAVYPPFGELVNMEVLPAFRGRGGGGALVDECVAEMSRMGFMAVFLQTHADLTPALRLYERKGFLLAAKGVMLRLVRFLNLPLLDWFRYGHPLAVYEARQGEEPRQWQLIWADWATGHKLMIALTGGSCDKDSDDCGPGISSVAASMAALGFRAALSGPTVATKGEQIRLSLDIGNDDEEVLHMAARLLLPPGCTPVGEWQKHGPACAIEPGEELNVHLQVALDAGVDLRPLSYSSWLSLPLTVEVFVGNTSFWLTHLVLVDGVKDLIPEARKGARSIGRAQLMSPLQAELAVRQGNEPA